MPRSRLALELTELLLDFAPGQRSVGVTMALHLCEAAIHKQFRSRDVAGVVGCEKHHSLGDLIGCAETCRTEYSSKSSSCVLRLLRWNAMGACRYSPGLPRSRECDDPLNRLSLPRPAS